MRKAMLAAAAVLLGLVLVRADAMARGGMGGGFHAGGFGAFPMRGFGGSWRFGSHWGGMGRQGSRLHDARSVHRDRRDMGHHGDGRHMARHDHDDHDHRELHRDGGHWRHAHGFGDMRHAAAAMDGQWHRASGFGDARHNASPREGEWHVEGRH